MTEIASLRDEEVIKERLSTVIWRNLTSIAGITIVLSVVVLIAASIKSGPSILVNTVVTGGMWALLSVGLSLIFGVMNIPNFAHGEFFMVGSLTSYLVYTPIRDYLSDHPSPVLSMFAPFIGIFAALLAGMLLGVVIEKFVFYQLRKRSREQWVMNAFLLTVGLSVIIINAVLLIWGPNFKGIPNYWPSGIDLWGVKMSMDRIVSFALAMVTIGIFWYFLRQTRTGRAIRAVAQDETGSLMVGIDLNGIQLLTMALGAGLAAMAGASLLFMFPSYPTVGLKPLYVAWYVVILVGLGNVAGAIVGGFIVALLQTLTAYYIGTGWEEVIPTGIIILILVFRPSGLFGSEVKGVWEQ